MSQPIQTNATAANTAAFLADAYPGRFRGLIIQKIGVERGRGSDRKTYGDDLVHYVLFGGFHYDRLVRRSLDQLQAMDPAALVAEFASRGITDGFDQPIRLAAVCKAIMDLDESFQKTLDGTNASTRDHVFDPLVVDGEPVRGAQVYKCVAADPNHECQCRDCTGNTKAPVAGQINISGLIIGQSILEPAANGPIPASKSRADVVAKRIIRSRLPIGRYREFRLEPGVFYALTTGPQAAQAADQNGVTCDPARVKAVTDLMVG